MKKNIFVIALCALTALCLGSCVKPLEEPVQPGDGVRTVTFNAALADQTRTGLYMRFVPKWMSTDVANVHLFADATEGTNVTMSIEPNTNDEVAHFTADFGTDHTIIVTPSSRAGSSTSYTGILAQRVGGNYLIPSTQSPQPGSLIDPNADFLVADGSLASDSGSGTQVNLNFRRPVSVSRLAIMNIEGQSIKSVKITSTDKLTGSVAYEDIDFAAGTAAFDAQSGSTELTLSYGENGIAVDATSTFYAYFISLPGSKNITAVEVTTNRYIYTKTFGTGKTLTFNTTDIKNIAVDMSKVEPEVIVAPHYYQKVMSSSEIESGASYLIVYENGSSSKVFKPILNNAGTQFVENDPSNAVNASISLGDWIPSSAAVDACQIIISDIKGDAATSHKYAIGVPSTDGYYFHPYVNDTDLPFTADKAPMDYRAETTVTNGVLAMVTKSYYVVYNTENNAFRAYYTTASGYQPNVALYKYIDGSHSTSVGAYVKVNNINELPSVAGGALAGDFIFVYESGAKAYVFKPICGSEVPSTATGDGDGAPYHVELTKAGSAIPVNLLSEGIAATADVVACKVQFSKHSGKEAWNTFAVDMGHYIRLNNDSNNGTRILAMYTAGYSSACTISGTGNNVTFSRTDGGRTAYLNYNATDSCFEATATESKVSIYKLSE